MEVTVDQVALLVRQLQHKAGLVDCGHLQSRVDACRQGPGVVEGGHNRVVTGELSLVSDLVGLGLKYVLLKLKTSMCMLVFCPIISFV